MVFQTSQASEDVEYLDKAIITVRMENGKPVVEPEVVYLNNGGEIQWCFQTEEAGGCEIRFRTESDESCPFVFPDSTGCTPAEEGCFTFKKMGEFLSIADRKDPKLQEEIWEYDVVVGGVIYDPVIRLRNTPEGSG